jgi:hypothetical protein
MIKLQRNFNAYQGNLTDIETVEQDLNDYLFWNNTKKVHKSLNYQTSSAFTQQFLKTAN